MMSMELDEMICPYCGETICPEMEMKVVTRAVLDVGEFGDDIIVYAEPDMNEMDFKEEKVFCPECGKEFDDDDIEKGVKLYLEKKGGDESEEVDDDYD